MALDKQITLTARGDVSKAQQSFKSLDDIVKTTMGNFKKEFQAAAGDTKKANNVVRMFERSLRTDLTAAAREGGKAVADAGRKLDRLAVAADRSTKHIKTTSTQVKKMAVTFNALAALHFGGQIISWARSASKAAAETETSFGHLRGALAVTGKDADVSAGNLRNLAYELSQLSGRSMADVMSGMAQIARRSSISSEKIEQLTRLSISLSNVMGKSLVDAAKDLSLMMDQPIERWASLGAAGVSLDKSIKGVVASLIASGQKVQAQELMISELTRAFGEQEAVADSVGAAFTRLGITIGEMNAVLAESGFGESFKFGLEVINVAIRDTTVGFQVFGKAFTLWGQDIKNMFDQLPNWLSQSLADLGQILSGGFQMLNPFEHLFGDTFRKAEANIKKMAKSAEESRRRLAALKAASAGTAKSVDNLGVGMNNASIAGKKLAESTSEANSQFNGMMSTLPNLNGSIAASASTIDIMVNKLRGMAEHAKSPAGKLEQAMKQVAAGVKIAEQAIASAPQAVERFNRGLERLKSSGLLGTAEGAKRAKDLVKALKDELNDVPKTTTATVNVHTNHTSSGSSSAPAGGGFGAGGNFNSALGIGGGGGAPNGGIGLGPGGSNYVTSATGRSSGGSIFGGSSYLVGEKGPELITAGSTGHVLENSLTELLKVLTGFTGGGVGNFLGIGKGSPGGGGTINPAFASLASRFTQPFTPFGTQPQISRVTGGFRAPTTYTAGLQMAYAMRSRGMNLPESVTAQWANLPMSAMRTGSGKAQTPYWMLDETAQGNLGHQFTRQLWERQRLAGEYSARYTGGYNAGFQSAPGQAVFARFNSPAHYANNAPLFAGEAEALAGWQGRSFARGGRPQANRASLVGENGPEMFVPDVSGRVVPNAGAAGEAKVIVNNYSSAQVDVDQAADGSRRVNIRDSVLHIVAQGLRPGGRLNQLGRTR